MVCYRSHRLSLLFSTFFFSPLIWIISVDLSWPSLILLLGQVYCWNSQVCGWSLLKLLYSIVPISVWFFFCLFLVVIPSIKLLILFIVFLILIIIYLYSPVILWGYLGQSSSSLVGQFLDPHLFGASCWRFTVFFWLCHLFLFWFFVIHIALLRYLHIWSSSYLFQTLWTDLGKGRLPLHVRAHWSVMIPGLVVQGVKCRHIW